MLANSASLSSPLDLFVERLRGASAQHPAGQGVMVVVAHPDDEVIGLGGQLRLLRDAGILHVTDGAPRNLRDAESHGFTTAADYASARRRELEAALVEATVPADRLRSFDVADQEAAWHLPELATRLADLFAADAVQLVLTHCYEGGHPDHDATAFAVAAACGLIERAGSTPPLVVEMPFYRAGESGPLYQNFPDADGGTVLELQLTAEQQSLKRRMLAHFRTQAETLAPFQSETECFRAATRYDFTALPNGGHLQYERWGLGVTGAEWQRVAAAALEVLGLAP